MDNSEKNWLSRHLKLIIIIVVVLVLAVLAFFALRGKTTVTGAYPASIKTGSIVCEKSGVDYPYTGNIVETSSGKKTDSSETETSFQEDESETMKETTATNSSNNIRVIGTFNESKHIEKISLDYTAYFSDKSASIAGEAHLHANFGKRLAAEGLEYSEFSNHFDIFDKKVILSLYANIDDITEKNYKYLLLDSYPKARGVKYQLGAFEDNFKQKGYKCVSTGDK